MPASYHMYPAEHKLLTFDFSPATGGTFADPLTGTPTITVAPLGTPTGTLTAGTPTRYTNTVTVLVSATGAVAEDTFIIECLAQTTAGQTLQDNMKITFRAATEV